MADHDEDRAARHRRINAEIAERRRREEADRDERRQRTFVMPECCAEMIRTAAVALAVNDGFASGDRATPPTWVVRTGNPREGSHDTFGYAAAKFCPFCAAAVPAVEPRTTDRKVCVVTDGGYYCDACSERCNACTCLPPAFHWQPVGSTRPVPVFVPEVFPEEEDGDAGGH